MPSSNDCDRPAFEPSDSISVNCDPVSRDNYALVPYNTAPMAPSGPQDWAVKKVIKLLELVAESCRRSYDPLTCVDGIPGYWEDLAAKFRAAGLGKMVDTGYDNKNNCFPGPSNNPTYTIQPIDPVSIRDFDMSTYPWSNFFDMSHYYRTSWANVQPAPPEAPIWGVYQLYEYPGNTCSYDPFTECKYAAMPMEKAREYEAAVCVQYADVDLKKISWERTPNASTFAIHDTVSEFLTESNAKNQAKDMEKNCGWYVYEVQYMTSCGTEPVCKCQFMVLNKKMTSSCHTIGKEEGDPSTVPSACFGATKIKFIKRGGPYTHKATADAEMESLLNKCQDSSSSLVVWQVYHRFHYSGDCIDGEESDSCDFIVSSENLETDTCLPDDVSVPSGPHTRYEWVPDAVFFTKAEADAYAAELRNDCLQEVYYYVYWLIDGCAADPEKDEDCNYRVISSTELETLIEDCLVSSGYDINDFCCTLTDTRYINQTSSPFSTYAEAQAHANELRHNCRGSSSSTPTSCSSYCVIEYIEEHRMPEETEPSIAFCFLRVYYPGYCQNTDTGWQPYINPDTGEVDHYERMRDIILGCYETDEDAMSALCCIWRYRYPDCILDTTVEEACEAEVCQSNNEQ